MPTGIKPKNKLRRQATHLSIKKAKEAAKRDERMRRKREESRNPALAEERRSRNVPHSIDSKRTWDEAVGDEDAFLSVDLEQLAKKRRLEEEAAERGENVDNEGEETLLGKLKRRDAELEDEEEAVDDEVDSMLDSDTEGEEEDTSDSDSDSSPGSAKEKRRPDPPKRASSPATSTATNFALTPELLKSKFPSLFEPIQEPKILVTTSLHSTLHKEAQILTDLFPNSTYVRRTAHARGHKYSIREISNFASNRGYTTLVILMEESIAKRPGGLDIVHLPNGPMFHFSVSNWVNGKSIPGHGNATGHYPELILNNFRTPLGILTAKLFQTLVPPQPELEGRQVLTIHNQRDFIFVRRHRYIFREKRNSEKAPVGTDGKTIPGFEETRVGLQEIGPRFTLKLRRIDRGIQRRSGQEWEWKGKMDKQRTKFNM